MKPSSPLGDAAAHYVRVARALALGASLAGCTAAAQGAVERGATAAGAARAARAARSDVSEKQRGAGIPSRTTPCPQRARPTGPCTPRAGAPSCYAFSGQVRFACACRGGSWQCRRDVPPDFLGPLPPPDLPTS